MIGIARLFVMGLCMAFVNVQAQTTGTTGGNLPFNNLQPSLVVTEVLPLAGIYPSRDGGTASGDTLGFVYNFAGNFAPAGTAAAQGQVLPIVQNTPLFSLLGTTYGGNGQTTYALPNLTGTAIVGTGTGAGLSTQNLGANTGTVSVTLSTAQLPAHVHTLSAGGVTGATGGNQPIDNMQPSLPLTRVIATEGVYPLPGAGAAFLGQVATFAGNFAPGGWMAANGQLLQIAQNTALFSILGTTYGGNGVTTFALPDLQGRVSVGASANNPLGTTFGGQFTTLSTAQMPAHDHTVPSSANTGNTGGGAPVNNDQPSLALNYLIAVNGIFPSRDGGGSFNETTPVLGQIVEFAGSFVPNGWLLANGQLLPINQNQALFSLLGTQYGGDGRTTFALPDLRGRTLIGAGGDYFVGEVLGADTTTLTVANLAAHDHTIAAAAVPEPDTYAMLLAGLGLLGYAARRRKQPAD